MADKQALQDIWPQGTCYGCGPANQHGFHLKSFWSDDEQFIVAEFEPQPKYNAGFPNVMYGGLVASLIDCHSIWTAIGFTYQSEGRDHGAPPSVSYVTGQLTVKYLKPTPLNQTIHLKSWIDGDVGRKMTVACELGTTDEVTATGEVIAVRIAMDKALGA